MNRGQSRSDVLFLHRSARGNFAITPQSILFAPMNVQLRVAGGQINPTVSYIDTTENVVNIYHGKDPEKWIQGIPVHQLVRLSNVYHGIDLEYLSNDRGELIMRWRIQPGSSSDLIELEIPHALSVELDTQGNGIFARFDTDTLKPGLSIPKPSGFHQNGGVKLPQEVSFRLLGPEKFGLQAEGRDPTRPFVIDLVLSQEAPASFRHWIDSAKNIYHLESLTDAAGSEASGTGELWSGCVAATAWIPCSDAVITKYSSSGKLLFRTYLSGTRRDLINSIKPTQDGNLIITGITESSNFPISADAYQKVLNNIFPTRPPGLYEINGNHFAAILNPSSGRLQHSTYLPKPSRDALVNTVVANNSIYFIYYRALPQLPVSGGAFQSTCSSNPCTDGYAIRLNSSLKEAIYATYLPGWMSSFQIHTDGSLYFGGFADSSFPTTPNAFQKTTTDRNGFLARLHPNGGHLIFGTFYNRAELDGIHELAVAPDGSVWATASLSPYREKLFRLNESGSKVLHETEVDTQYHLGLDKNGNIFSFVYDSDIRPSENALLSYSCGAGAFIKRNPQGEQTFATYLPAHSNFEGLNENNELLLKSNDGSLLRLIENQAPSAPYAGCVLDAAQFTSNRPLTPGELVSIFGTGLGPKTGVSFQLENDRLPRELAGTQVLINGEPASLLYVSDTQINLVLPYTLEQNSQPVIQVITPGSGTSGMGNKIQSYKVHRSEVYIFQIQEHGGLAAALNQDNTLNTRQNPAKRGSSIVLFGTGGGETEPVSVSGEVTPLMVHPLKDPYLRVRIPGSAYLTIEYAGGAPGLVSGVTQINLKIPADLPDSALTDGMLPIYISTSSGSSMVHIAVE